MRDRCRQHDRADESEHEHDTRRDQQDRQCFAPAQMMHGHEREHEQDEALEERQGREPAGCRKQFQEGTEQHQGDPEQD